MVFKTNQLKRAIRQLGSLMLCAVLIISLSSGPAYALCGCYIDVTRGVVKVTDIDAADYAPIVPGLPEGAYHVYDYQLFFRNLQQNVQDRLAAYLAVQIDQAA